MARNTLGTVDPANATGGAAYEDDADRLERIRAAIRTGPQSVPAEPGATSGQRSPTEGGGMDDSTTAGQVADELFSPEAHPAIVLATTERLALKSHQTSPPAAELANDLYAALLPSALERAEDRLRLLQDRLAIVVVRHNLPLLASPIPCRLAGEDRFRSSDKYFTTRHDDASKDSLFLLAAASVVTGVRVLSDLTSASNSTSLTLTERKCLLHPLYTSVWLASHDGTLRRLNRESRTALTASSPCWPELVEDQRVDHSRWALRRWRLGHHAFHTTCQALAIVLARYRVAAERRRMSDAVASLDEAARLFDSAAACLLYATDLGGPEVYQGIVRPHMAAFWDAMSGNNLSDHDYVWSVVKSLELPKLLDRDEVCGKLRAAHLTLAVAVQHMLDTHRDRAMANVGEKTSMKVTALGGKPMPVGDILHKINAARLTVVVGR